MADPDLPAGTGPTDRASRHLRAAPGPTHPGRATPAEPHAQHHPFEQLRRSDPELRRLHLQVRTWALQAGLVVDRDGLTALLATLLEARRASGVDPRWWTVERVGEVAWSGCAGWAARGGLRLPSGTAAALTQFWLWLAAAGGFGPGSDCHEDLVEALSTHCRPARAPTSRKHPAARKQNIRV